MHTNKTHSDKQPDKIPEDDDRNVRNRLGYHTAISPPLSSRPKKNIKKISTSSLEHLEKKTS